MPASPYTRQTFASPNGQLRAGSPGPPQMRAGSPGPSQIRARSPGSTNRVRVVKRPQSSPPRGVLPCASYVAIAVSTTSPSPAAASGQAHAKQHNTSAGTATGHPAMLTSPGSALRAGSRQREGSASTSTSRLHRSETQQGRASSLSARSTDARKPRARGRSVRIETDTRITDVSLPQKQRSEEARASSADPFMTSFMDAWDFATDHGTYGAAENQRFTERIAASRLKKEGKAAAPPAAADSRPSSFKDAWDCSLETRLSMHKATSLMHRQSAPPPSSKREFDRITDVPVPQSQSWLCNEVFSEKPLGALFYPDKAVGA